MAELSSMKEGEYQLFDYQQISVEELLKHDRYAIWGEVGVGKTLIAVAAVNRLPEGKVLVLAPKRVIDGVWKKLDTPIKHPVEYLNYERLSRMDTYPTADYVILDESQKVKASNTKIAKQVRAISKRAKRVYCLSGTPVGNSYIDVFNIFKNIGIPEFQYPEAAFIAKYYITYSIPVHTRFGDKMIPQLIDVRHQFVDELMATFGKYSNSIKMTDVHHLPDKHEFPIYVDGMRGDDYALIEQGIIKLDDDVSVVAKLEAINKCHQAANGFMYYKNFDTDKNHVKRINGATYKLDKLKEIVNKHKGENIVIIYKFQADHDIIWRELTKMGRTVVDDFADIDVGDILLLQVGAAEGINLQTWSHTMIFYSFDYSHLSYTQASGRIYRVGQKHEVNYYILISKGTVEEKIYKAIEQKQSLDDFIKAATKLEV